MAALNASTDSTIERLIRFFVREEQYADGDHRWFARSVFIYSMIGAAVAGFYSIFYWYFAAHGASLSLGFLVLVCAATVPLHRLGKCRIAAKINLAATSIGLAGVVANMGGIDSSAACWLLGVTPGITALLFRRAKEIAQFTSFTLFLYVGVFCWELSGHEVYFFQFPEGSVVERIYTAVHFIGFSLFIAVALAIFATTQRKLLNDVERQSRDVKAILSNIHQGIFTLVSADMQLGTDYSKYLETIVGTKDLDARNAAELIFQKSNLNTEQKDMIENIVANCIDETSLNFMANEENLIRDLVFRTAEGVEKQLLLDWQPIINEKLDKTEKILVTMLDVTEQRAMEQQNRKQQREIEIILEINELDEEKFEKFMKSSMQFIAESERITQTSQNHENLKILFINMHTLKGAARTYRMKHLTATIHDCEQYYAQVQRSEKVWNGEESLRNLHQVRAVFEDYESISRNKLKRGHKANQVRIDLESIRENVRLLQDIEGYSLDDRLTPFLETAKRTFYGLYYMDTDTLFEDVCRGLPALAKDLGKLPPELHFQSVDAGVTTEGADLLKNVFVHLLRNTMDHGIETPEVREGKGKNPQGNIHIEITVGADEMMAIRLWDDGGGLALDRIHKIGVQKGLIDPARASPQAVAELIFDAGLSTAKAVTDISGRGVGMSAVREFIEKAGGRIELHLKEAAGPLQPTPCEFVLMIPEGYYFLYKVDQVVA